VERERGQSSHEKGDERTGDQAKKRAQLADKKKGERRLLLIKKNSLKKHLAGASGRQWQSVLD